jgi:DNA-binding MurR/RpiR family transcriptional regulator
MNETTDPANLPFDERIEASLALLSPAEQRMARFFIDEKEAVLLGSAAQIASQAGASDATVVRTAKSLGFDGLFHLRETLLADLTGNSSPGVRLRRTLEATGEGASGALSHVLATHRETLEIFTDPQFEQRFGRVIDTLFSAKRRHVFGIGPSGGLADYAALQFNRIGLDTTALSTTGIALADRMLAMGEGDAVLVMAYAPIYREVEVTLEFAERCNIPVLLISDSLGPFVHGRITEVLAVPRGRADHLSMHAGTMVLIEAMIVALAARDRTAALSSLEKFGAVRGTIDKLWLKRGIKKSS